MDRNDSIFELDDIHQVAEQIRITLERPVIIETKNFELISYSSPDDSPFDSTQQKTILTKKCPANIIERLKQEGLVERLETERKPIRVLPMEDYGFFQRVVVSAKHNMRMNGFIWIHETGATLLDEDDMTYLSRIAAHVGRLIHKQYVQKESAKERLLRKLLNDEYINEKQIDREAKQASFSLPERFTVLVAHMADPSYFYLLHRIKKLADASSSPQISSYISRGSEMVFVIGGALKQEGDSIGKAYEVIARIKERLSSEELDIVRMGVGNEYTQIRYMRQSFLQALEVIETSIFVSPTIHVPIEHARLGMYRYLTTIYEKNSVEKFRNVSILKIMQKDEENQSELLKTLWVYLCNNGKLKRTAEQLFIHPNTLNYRIKQIIELTNLDLNDFNITNHLYTELLLIYNNKEYCQMYKEDRTLALNFL